MDLRAADTALKRRATFLRAVGLEAREEGRDIGHSPPVWDGIDLHYEWRELEQEEATPPGWFRYGMDYWLC